MTWMKVYESFEEAMNNIWETQHEQKNGIKITNKKIIYDFDDLKLIEVSKSDKQKGVVILYKPFLNNKKWVVWIPSGNQQKNLLIIASYLFEIDNHNSKFWRKDNEN